uniref:HMG box domain-containing protein n=1 Tax=Kalanchoe fedtschenkoi TaxID=63787 RepID=A0A7N0TQ65_KALFE
MKLAKGKEAGSKKDTKEALKPVENKNVGKRKAPPKADTKSKKAAKTKNDPNKPKRPASAFFVFLEEFRKTYKLENPNEKAVSAVGKAGGAKWKSLSKAEKAPYEAKAAKRKTDYEKQMTAYNKKKDTAADDDIEEASKKRKPQVVDEADEESEEEDDEDEDEDDEDDD